MPQPALSTFEPMIPQVAELLADDPQLLAFFNHLHLAINVNGRVTSSAPKLKQPSNGTLPTCAKFWPPVISLNEPMAVVRNRK